MSIGTQIRRRREELGMSQEQLAKKLQVGRTTICNYESGTSSPKEEMLIKILDALEVDPNYLYRGSYRHGFALSGEEQGLVEKYRALGRSGRQTVQTMLTSLTEMHRELTAEAPRQKRTIPLYFSPAAAGFAAPVFMEDYEPLEVTDEVPAGADLAVRIQGDSMAPLIADGSVVYVNRDPLRSGDVGIFCLDGEMLCKQYHRDSLGMVYLFSLNRARAEMDVVLGAESGRSLTCFGRVMVHNQPLPR